MIEEKHIDEINNALLAHGLDEDALKELRNKWPEMHFTFCSDDDVCGPTAIRTSADFSIYLIDSRHHCLSFTNSIEVATGLVLAEHEDDV